MAEKAVAEKIAHPDSYNHFVAEEARWSAFVISKINVGTALNKSSGALEDKYIIENWTACARRRHARQLHPEFPKNPLRDENFEFRDVLGAAYEYLIKFFADSAGKKAGEFYTPADIVRTLVEIVEPQPGVSVCTIARDRFRFFETTNWRTCDRLTNVRRDYARSAP